MISIYVLPRQFQYSSLPLLLFYGSLIYEKQIIIRISGILKHNRTKKTYFEQQTKCYHFLYKRQRLDYRLANRRLDYCKPQQMKRAF